MQQNKNTHICGNISTMCHSTSLKICNLCYNLHIPNFNGNIINNTNMGQYYLDIPIMYRTYIKLPSIYCCTVQLYWNYTMYEHVNSFPFTSLECSTEGLVVIGNGLSEATNIISLKRKWTVNCLFVLKMYLVVTSYKLFQLQHTFCIDISCWMTTTIF